MELATHRCRAELEVALSAEDAFELFTPEGERAWVHGWAPTYHSAGADRSAPGTVFTTDHGGAVTTWVVVAREPGRRIMYTRVSDWVGTVDVAVREHGPDRAIVAVEYVLTPLDVDAGARLAHFVAHYPAFIAGWRDEIGRYLGRAGPTGVWDHPT
jgi:hypothetical protein